MCFVPTVNSTIGPGNASRVGVAPAAGQGMVQGPWAAPGEGGIHIFGKMHGQMGQLSVPEAMRDALVRLWWLRRQRPRKSSKLAIASCEHVLYLMQMLLCQHLDPNWRESYRLVATVLSQTVRASRGGVHEQRPTHASITTSDSDSGDAGSQAAALELSGVPEWEAEGFCPSSTSA